MTHPWHPGEPGDDELERLFSAAAEAWRGDVHHEDDAWRGEEHLPDWPEEAAGPEYWMYKDAARGS